MAGVLNRLDRRGHGEIARWANDRVSQDRARRVFNEHQAHGYNIADVSKGEGVFLKEFDPKATELLAVPQLVGG